MSDEGSTIPKFQIVLAAGIPVAALCIGAIAYYRWRKRHVSPVFQESSASASAAATGTEKENIQNSSSRSEVTDTSTETPTAPQEHIKSSDEEAESRAYRSPVVRARESKEKGNKHFKEGRYEKAIEYYTQAINFSPPSERSALAVYHHNRAAAYDQLSAKANGDEKKKFQENILADCSEALKCNPRYLKALMRRAKVAEAFDDIELAVRDLTAACMLESFQNAELTDRADCMLKELGQRKAKELFRNRKKELPSVMYIEQYLNSFSSYQLVDAVVKDGEVNTSSSETDDSSAVEQDPGLQDYQRVISAIRRRKYDSVLEKCTAAIDKGLTKDLPSALVIRGTFSLLKMENEDAISDFSQVLSMGDDRVSTKMRIHTLLKRSGVYQTENQDSKAKADFDRALDLDPDDCDIYHYRGQVHVSANNLPAAVEDFTRAIALNNGFVHPHIQLGYAQYKTAVLQQSKELLLVAEMTLENTVKQFPKCGEAYSVYGQMLLDRQEVKKATEMFEKALELCPGNGTPWVHKGLMLIQFGEDLNGGTAMIEKALEVDPKCEFAYETLAAFEIQKGHTERAIELFEKAMALVRSEAELAQAYSLCNAAVMQQQLTKELGIIPAMPWGNPPMFSTM